jgi:arginyl-tRNA synthetase
MVKERLQAIVAEVLRELQLDPGGPVVLEAPRERRHGDYSTNVALVLAKRAGRAPAELAREIAARLQARADLGASVSLAGPGFINFTLAEGGATSALASLLERGPALAKSDSGAGERVQIEFVSANPTGPLNVVSARAAAYGSTLARMLDAAGFAVATEFYVNDAGRQVELLGGSVRAHFVNQSGGEEAIPEDGYQGDYVRDLALLVPPESGRTWLALGRDASWRAFGEFAVARVLEWQQAALAAFGVRFDRWYRESELHASDRVQETLQLLEAAGHVYRSEGALLFRTTTWGDDKDRVVVRSDGTPTYFLADAAYHRDKHERGFRRVIDVWGPDHHGHIPRMQAVARALGFPAEWLEVVIIQWVKLIEGGAAVKMSKRAGQLVTLGDLLEEVPADVAKYFFLMRHQSSHLDFDLELAKRTSEENPVYYVQYAHARICSIEAKAAAAGMRLADGEGGAAAGAPAPQDVPLGRLEQAEELELAKLLVDFPGFVARAAAAREPHRLTGYCEDVARSFHRFYHEHRVLQEDRELALARLALCVATRRVLAAGLGLMGIAAPAHMEPTATDPEAREGK